MRRWLGGLGIALLLATASVRAQADLRHAAAVAFWTETVRGYLATVGEQPGPFSAQIQRAIAALTSGTTVFTLLNATTENVTTLCLDQTNKDTCFTRVAAGILQLSGSNANNSFRIPNGANPEYALIGWDGSNFMSFIGVTNGGTNRSGRFGAASALVIQSGGSDRWQFNTSGHLVPLTDANVNIGDSTHGVLAIHTSGGTTIASTANKLLQVNDSGNTTGLEFNGGTPTLGTCTGGTLVSGSHNSGGEVTGNTSGSCIINFGTPNFTNTPFCFVNDETALIAVRISARSNASITVTGAGSGDAFQFFCIGRIGT